LPVGLEAFNNVVKIFLSLSETLQGISRFSQYIRSCPGTCLNVEESAQEYTEELCEELAGLGRKGRNGGIK